MEGLLIRASRMSDAEALCALANRPLVQRQTLRTPFTPVSFYEGRLKNQSPATTHLVADLEGRVVGEAALMRRLGRQSHSAELFIVVHDEFWRRGIASRLMDALMDQADQWLGLRRVFLTVFPDNAPAITLYERYGFEREGVMRADSIRDGALHDVLVMARLREPLGRAAPDG